jgi:hypothetical protein
MNNWRAESKQFVFTTVVVAALVFGATVAVADWTQPLSSAPTCTSGNAGCDAPLNVTAMGQTKLGGLVLNTATSPAPNGLIVAAGKVALGTLTPNPTGELTVANASGHGIVATGQSTGSSYYGVYGAAGSYYGALGRADGYSIVGNGAAYFGGAGTFGGGVNIGGAISVGSTANVASTLVVSGGVNFSGTEIHNGAAIEWPGIANGNGNRFLCFTDANNTIHPATSACPTVSDIRLKENVVDTPSLLDDLTKIHIVNFDLKSDPEHKLNTGVIAQELYKIFPYMVTVGGDDPTKNPWGVDYSELGVVALKSVQELDLNVNAITSAPANSEAQNFAANFFSSVFSHVTMWLADAGNGIKDLFVGNVHAKSVNTDELCVGKVCVTQEEFLKIVGQNYHEADPANTQ